MTRICQGHEGYECDVSLEGEHFLTKRCKSCSTARRDRLHRERRTGYYKTADDDHCTELGARRLKAMIEAYWEERGRSVNVALHRSSYVPKMRSSRTDLRSDITNGWPPKTAPAKPSQSIGALEGTSDMVEELPNELLVEKPHPLSRYRGVR